MSEILAILVYLNCMKQFLLNKCNCDNTSIANYTLNQTDCLNRLQILFHSGNSTKLIMSGYLCHIFLRQDSPVFLIINLLLLARQLTVNHCQDSARVQDFKPKNSHSCSGHSSTEPLRVVPHFSFSITFPFFLFSMTCASVFISHEFYNFSGLVSNSRFVG